MFARIVFVNYSGRWGCCLDSLWLTSSPLLFIKEKGRKKSLIAIKGILALITKQTKVENTKEEHSRIFIVTPRTKLHRIIDQLRVGGTPEDAWSHPAPAEPPRAGAQLGLKLSKKGTPGGQREPPALQVVPSASGPGTGHHWQEPGFIFATSRSRRVSSSPA